MSDELKIVYMPLSQVQRLDGNPKLHDIGKIVESIQKHGFKDPPKLEPALNDGKGGIVEGNGRTEALLWMREGKFEAPRGIIDKDGEWYVPILVGVDAADALEAKAYAIDHNNLSLMGGDLTALDMATMYDREAYLEMLVELNQNGEEVLSVDGDDLDLLISVSEPKTPPTTPPSLADIEGAAGEMGERDFWPIIRVSVPVELFREWSLVMQSMGGEEHEKVAALLSLYASSV